MHASIFGFRNTTIHNHSKVCATRVVCAGGGSLAAAKADAGAPGHVTAPVHTAIGARRGVARGCGGWWHSPGWERLQRQLAGLGECTAPGTHACTWQRVVVVRGAIGGDGVAALAMAARVGQVVALGALVELVAGFRAVGGNGAIDICVGRSRGVAAMASGALLGVGVGGRKYRQLV